MLTDGYGQGTRRMGASATQVAGRTAAVPPYRYGPEDGGPDEPEQRGRRAWPWVALAVVVVVLIASIFLIKELSGTAGGVAVPNIQNDTLPVAKQALTGAGFNIGTISQRHSASVSKGLVINSSPGFGANEAKGTAIGIIVSTGSATKAVPSVVGDSKSDAISALKSAGFNYTITTVPAANSGYGPNTVVKQNPAASAQAAPGSSVTLTVTSSTVTVPNSIIGETLSQATLTLSQAPYNYTVQSQTLPGQPGTVGTVYASSPSPGKTLAPGATIVLYVVGAASSSPATSPSPTPPSSSSPSPPVSPSP
jgi:serine/threonine-protein kinase